MTHKTREQLLKEFEFETGDRPVSREVQLLREYALRGEAPPLEFLDSIRIRPARVLTPEFFEEAKRGRR